MERLENLIRGCVRLEITGTFPEGLLNSLSAAGIRFWRAESVDAYTLRVTVAAGDASAAAELGRRCMCRTETLYRRGMPDWRRRAKRRAAFVICAGALLLAIMASSFFVWKIEIRGGDRVSDASVLRALEESGVYIGSFWPGFNSDMIRNSVLLKLPELSWLGVSVDSSRAVVTVRERVEKPEFVNGGAPGSVTARRTGIIESVSALQGAALVKKGDAVTEGETLVSGAVESSLSGTRYVHAQAVVIARTWYELTASAPLEEAVKDYSGRSFSRWAIVFGSRRFNFYISSSKMYRGCDKIICTYPLAMDGVFTLPVTVVRERLCPYEAIASQADADGLSARLRQTLEETLTERLDGRGQIKTRGFTQAVQGDGLTVTLRAECLEDIAQEAPLSP